MVILGLFAAFVGFEAISRSPCQIAWDGFVLGKQSATLVLTLKLSTLLLLCTMQLDATTHGYCVKFYHDLPSRMVGRHNVGTGFR